MQDKPLLNQAFKELRKKGYFARQNFLCCQTCGWDAVPYEKSRKAVFYHGQDAQHIKSGNIDEHGIYMCWDGNGDEIVSVFKSLGFIVTWRGDYDSRIRVDSQNKEGVYEKDPRARSS